MIDSPVCRIFVLIGLWAIVMGGICEKAFASRIPFDKIKKSASDSLSKVDAQALWSDLSQPEARITEHARNKVEAYASQGVDIVPFLLGLRGLGPELGKEGGPSRVLAAKLGYCARGILPALYDQRLPVGTQRRFDSPLQFRRNLQ